MDNQPTAINELHTGIFTFVMSLYSQYCKTMPKEAAKEKVVEYIRDLADYFEQHETNTTHN